MLRQSNTYKCTIRFFFTNICFRTETDHMLQCSLVFEKKTIGFRKNGTPSQTEMKWFLATLPLEVANTIMFTVKDRVVFGTRCFFFVSFFSQD